MAYTIRLPENLYSRVKETATRERRSLNGEIIYRLLRSFEREDAAPLPAVSDPIAA